jgi:hypothetical protein
MNRSVEENAISAVAPPASGPLKLSVNLGSVDI